MGAINFNYNPDLVYTIIDDNVITVKNKENSQLVYKFPIPRDFQIVGDCMWCGRPTYVITPYKLNQPQYIPEGYKNLKLHCDGIWHAVNDEGRQIKYIDTTVIKKEDFELVTLGRFKISEDEIPEPFWVADYTGKFDYVSTWTRVSEIQNKVEMFDKNARLITEEELICIFALSDKGFEFWDYLPEEVYETSFMRDLDRYCLCSNEISMDNWDIVVSSRETSNLYRRIHREKARDFYESFWYKNTAFYFTGEDLKPFHVYPVLDNKSKTNEQTGPKLIKK